ncbi:hypothetical protein WJX72_001624 [[Myrmecia] bisecta]|uniref:U3 small nucleolar ribonucleoprotein protein MPP10 n=1 Tax=[Myrmecia] bisecta TaxID=41462 RepID=A0AAW1QP38_9CHLO
MSSSHEEETELSALDAFAPDTAVALAAFGTAASAPTAFVQPSAEVSGLARLAAKALYDYAAAYAPAASSSQAAAASALPELHVDGFDAEQIWLQLELQSGPVLKRARRLLRKLGDEPQLLTPETEEALKDVIGGSEDERSSREDSDADLDGDVAGQDLDLDQGQAGNEDGADLDDSGLEDFEGGSSDSGGQPSQACKRKRGEALKPTEDAFMRLDDMERFMEEAEQQAGREGDEDEEDEDFAGFGDGEIEDEEDAELAAVLDNAARLAGKAPPKKLQRGRRRDASDEDDDDEHDGVADMMYEDFFGDRKPQRGQQGRGKARRGAAPDLDDDLAAEHQEADEDRDEDQEDDEDLAAADNGGFEDDAGLDAGEGAEGDELYTAEQLQGLLDGTLDLDTLQPAGGRQINKLGGSAAGGKGGGRGGADNATGEPLSAHERRLQRMQQRIERLQEAAMGEKDWFMRGEADAGARPINSVLEMDLDFERSVKPPPQPTEEATASLEELIRKRVTDHQFDDPPRMVAPPTDKRKTVLELDDKKSAKGLGELYEEEFVQKTTGSVAEDKDERVRAEARALMKALSAKLDALSHFHYAPKPVVEDMTVKADVPALAMEEVAPMVVSEANMRAPEEVFRAGGKGPPKSEAELSREERKRRRAAKKRAGKKHKQQQLGDKRATAVSKGGEANIIGRKSDAALAPASRKKAPQHGRSEFSKSAAVFAKLQDQRNMAAAGIKVAPITDKPAHKASNLKL